MATRTVATFIAHVQIEAVRIRLVLVFGYVALGVATLVFAPVSGDPISALMLGALATVVFPSAAYLFLLAILSTVQWIRGPPQSMTTEDATDVVQFVPRKPE